MEHNPREMLDKEKRREANKATLTESIIELNQMFQTRSVNFKLKAPYKENSVHSPVPRF